VGRESSIPNPAQIATDIVRQHADSAFVASITGTLSRAKQMPPQTITLVAASTLIAMVVSILLGLYVYRRIAIPLACLAEAATRVVARE